MSGRKTLRWVAILLLVLLAACVSGKNSGDMPEVELEKSHYYYDVLVHGGYLYATSPWGLEVFSIDGGKISLTGGYETKGEAQTLALSKERLYLSDATGRLYVFDVSTPARPRLIAELGLDKIAQRIVISGDRAYLACVSSGLVILDLQNLEEVGFYKPKNYSYPKGICLQDGKLYIADFTMRLYVADVVDDSLIFLASHPTSSVAHDVLAWESFVYVASSDGGVDVFKVSGKELELVQNHPLPGFALRLARYGNYLLVTLADEGVALLEIQKDGRLELVAQYDTPGNAYGIALANGYAYVADYDGGIVVFDLSQLPELVPVDFARPEVSP
jgi:hypothetical protein